MLSTIAEIIRNLLIFVGVNRRAAHRSRRSRLDDAQYQSAEAGTDRPVLSPRRYISGKELSLSR
jgi:hypothetical protein